MSKGQVVSQQLPRAPFGADRAAAWSTPGSFEVQGHALSSSASPSLTYEPHYGLKEKPFSLSADPRFLYRSPAHAPAFEELLTGIRRREGLIVLTGEIGTGKTTLIRSVLQHLDRRTFTAFVPDPFVSREDLLKMLLVDFGVVSLADMKRGSLAGASRPDLSYPLYEFLDSLVPLQAFAVLIIDEAQNLPLTLLEEIRILSDLEQREKLLQVVLVGQPELKQHLKMPQMRQVDQRVSVRCELTALGGADVGKYVRHRLTVASENGNHVQFSDGAITTIFNASGGVPRVINLICDRALQHGHRAKATLIESALIKEAATSLGIAEPGRDAPAVAHRNSRRQWHAARRRRASEGGRCAGKTSIGNAPDSVRVRSGSRPRRTVEWPATGTGCRSAGAGGTRRRGDRRDLVLFVHHPACRGRCRDVAGTAQVDVGNPASCRRCKVAERLARPGGRRACSERWQFRHPGRLAHQSRPRRSSRRRARPGRAPCPHG